MILNIRKVYRKSIVLSICLCYILLRSAT